jgi:NAD(P)-dependent dehydrogenase (short-subunit alcohol dehydrogenase family)
MRVAVFGATGAIGNAVCAQLEQDPAVARVYAFSRQAVTVDSEKRVSVRFDLLDEQSIRAAAARCAEEGALHLVFIATGVLHDGATLQPERSWRAITGEAMAQSYAVNSVGPALIAKHFLDLLSRDSKSVFAALSARVGSIEDNRLGGWHSYRASKAALHQLIRTVSVELTRRNPGAYCIGLHPGTVDSELSKPFQANVPQGQLFTPAYSAQRLLEVIDGLSPGASGYAYAWDGQRLAF